MSTTQGRATGQRTITRLHLGGAASNTPAETETGSHRGLVRLGLDIHDGPLQDLAAVGFALSLLRRELENVPADTGRVSAHLDEVSEQLRSVERSLRCVITNRSPAESTELIGLIRAEIDRFTRLAGTTPHLTIAGDVEPATDSQRIALQRVTREALTNIARHANAMSVELELRGDEHSIRLRISDDGVGFDVDARESVETPTKLGLRGMAKRLQLLGGSLVTESRPGGPTTVTASIERWRPAPD